MKYDRKKVRLNLKKFLSTGATKRGLSIEEIATRLGVTFWTVDSWKQGRRSPRIHTIEKIESEFKVKLR